MQLLLEGNILLNNKDRAWAEVKLKNIEHNFKEIKKYADTKVMCIIKADAYGHGILQVAQTLERAKADYFGVATLREAIRLRQSGVIAPILLLGFFEDKYIIDIIENNITLTIYDIETALNVSNIAVLMNKKAKIHIKVDTGMSRLGFFEDCVDVVKKIYNLDGIFVEGIFTHFSVADNDEKKQNTYIQAQKFENIVKTLENMQISIPIKHISASGAIIQYPEFKFNMVRAGIILYGYYPDEKINKKLDLKPAMTLFSKIAQVKSIKKGQSVSYGMNFEAPCDMKIAVVTIGYADGYLRANSNKSYILYKNKKANVIGNICMDMCMIDVSDIEDIKMGDNVVIFGHSQGNILGADTVSQFANTIPYEILCSVSKRVPRIYSID